MGNGPSVMNHDRFKDQIFSLVLYHTAQQANPDFRFALSENCTPDHLPAPENNDYRSLLNCYRMNDPKVSDYIDKHILNKEENLARFYQTLINQLRSTTNQNQPSRTNRRRQPLTRSQVDKLDRGTVKSQGKSQRTRDTYSTFKKGEFLNDEDIVSVNFPEATKSQQEGLFDSKIRETKMKLLQTFLTPDNQTDISEIERQIDEELDREFADLNNVDFDKLDLETIRSRIVERREISSKQTGKGGAYPTEANYSERPRTPSPKLEPTMKAKKRSSKTVKSELDDIYYQPNKKPSDSSKPKSKKKFVANCMIED